jgi:hypothetical protein
MALWRLVPHTYLAQPCAIRGSASRITAGAEQGHSLDKSVGEEATRVTMDGGGMQGEVGAVITRI